MRLEVVEGTESGRATSGEGRISGRGAALRGVPAGGAGPMAAGAAAGRRVGWGRREEAGGVCASRGRPGPAWARAGCGRWTRLAAALAVGARARGGGG